MVIFSIDKSILITLRSLLSVGGDLAVGGAHPASPPRLLETTPKLAWGVADFQKKFKVA